MNPFVSLSASDRFVMALEGVYAATAARFRSGVITVAMIWAVCLRIRRTEQLVMRLLAQFRAGTLPVGAVPSGAVRVKRARKADRRAAVALPRRFGWLLPLVPCAAAGFAGQLRAVLAEPEMAALLAASPRAVRALQPVCRMLAIEAAVLAPTAGAVGDAPPEGGAEERRSSDVLISDYSGFSPSVAGFQAEARPAKAGRWAQGPPWIT